MHTVELREDRPGTLRWWVVEPTGRCVAVFTDRGRAECCAWMLTARRAVA